MNIREGMGERVDARRCLSHRAFCLFIYLLICFLGLHLRHTGVPRLGVERELRRPGHSTATATEDLSLILDPHHSSQQRPILSPPSKARDWTCVPWMLVRLINCGAIMGTPGWFLTLIYMPLPPGEATSMFLKSCWSSQYFDSLTPNLKILLEVNY